MRAVPSCGRNEPSPIRTRTRLRENDVEPFGLYPGPHHRPRLGSCTRSSVLVPTLQPPASSCLFKLSRGTSTTRLIPIGHHHLISGARLGRCSTVTTPLSYLGSLARLFVKAYGTAAAAAAAATTGVRVEALQPGLLCRSALGRAPMHAAHNMPASPPGHSHRVLFL